MTETERNQIKGALLKCAEENENKSTLTGYIVVSSLCKSAVERIEELEKENADLKEQVEQMKCCGKQLFGENGKLDGHMSAKAWHYVTDKLPPNPKESEDGRHIKPLNYICAYDCGDGDYECGEFMYLGNGIWLGENKDYYPIYAWMDCAVEVPLPPRKGNK